MRGESIERFAPKGGTLRMTANAITSANNRREALLVYSAQKYCSASFAYCPLEAVRSTARRISPVYSTSHYLAWGFAKRESSSFGLTTTDSMAILWVAL